MQTVVLYMMCCMMETETFGGMSLGWAAIVVPTTATLFVFIVGYLLNGIIECCKNENQLKRLREDVYAWIDIVKIPLEKDIKLLQGFARQCATDTWLQPPQFNWTPLMGPKIEKVIDDDVMEAFLKRDGNQTSREKCQQAVFNLVSQARFLTEMEEQVKLKYDECSGLMAQLREKWEDTYLAIRKRINNLLSYDVSVNTEMHQKISRIIEKHNALVNSYPNDFEKSYQSLIEAMHSPLQDEQSILRLDDRFADAQVIHMKVAALRSGYSQLFAEFAKRLTASRQSLDDATAALRQLY